jgi:small nuclear ribonucleoprotein (snRNP)-like protein
MLVPATIKGVDFQVKVILENNLETVIKMSDLLPEIHSELTDLINKKVLVECDYTTGDVLVGVRNMHTLPEDVSQDALIGLAYANNQVELAPPAPQGELVEEEEYHVGHA